MSGYRPKAPRAIRVCEDPEIRRHGWNRGRHALGFADRVDKDWVLFECACGESGVLALCMPDVFAHLSDALTTVYTAENLERLATQESPWLVMLRGAQ